jgi:hypothetical protein
MLSVVEVSGQEREIWALCHAELCDASGDAGGSAKSYDSFAGGSRSFAVEAGRLFFACLKGAVKLID